MLSFSRKYSNYSKFPSKYVRNIFLEYFIDKNHKFIRSSPVVPFYDPSVAFVNAGMNQFKNVFLGQTPAPCVKAVNSQKCIRVGGKHNDLSIVGTDGYHHTFFEMLGNWSFGQFSKAEACELAYNLLIGPYRIDPNRLFITYYGGDIQNDLSPDLECLEIWKNLGIPSNRILPFTKENFWEMGTVGPCGTCTEIHIDHLSSSNSNTNIVARAARVNADVPDLTELWNIVFIEYNRNTDGTITPLPQKHIDTGMGMERLTSFLQNKSSNYDTDLFSPIISNIQKFSEQSPYTGEFHENIQTYKIDVAYRTLADHARMITACIADGMYPDQNYKLRRIIRKSIKICDELFKRRSLLREIIPTVTEIFNESYPEMQRNLSKILDVIELEEELLNALTKSTMENRNELLSEYPNLNKYELDTLPGFLPAYRELMMLRNSFTDNQLPVELMFKLYDTYGLNKEILEIIGENENLQINLNSLDVYMEDLKQKKKKKLARNIQVKNILNSQVNPMMKTLNNYKYDYRFNSKTNLFDVNIVTAKILHIFEDETSMWHIILDKSNFYYEAGGQEADIGIIIKCNAEHKIEFNVNNIENINDILVHSGTFTPDKSSYFNVGDIVELHVNSKHRTANILHHTATHLLNASVRKFTNKIVYQKSSKVNANNLQLELGIINAKVDMDLINQIQEEIKTIIKAKVNVKISRIDGRTVYEDNDIVLVPGEIYPEDNLRLITIENNDKSFISKELCCGTHVHNTLECKDFQILNVKQSGRSSYLFTAVCGEYAEKISFNGQQMLTDLLNMTKNFQSEMNLIEKLQKYRQILNDTKSNLPYLIRHQSVDLIDNLYKLHKYKSKLSTRNILETNMKDYLENCTKHPFIVHFISNPEIQQSIPLQKATKLCPDRPILLLVLINDLLKARCCVPANYIHEEFTADKWLRKIIDIFDTDIVTPKGQNIQQICNMKSLKIDRTKVDAQLDQALKYAREFAMDSIPKR